MQDVSRNHHSDTHSDAHSDTHLFRLTFSYIQPVALSESHSSLSHTHIHALTHARTRTHTHIHTHTDKQRQRLKNAGLLEEDIMDNTQLVVQILRANEGLDVEALRTFQVLYTYITYTYKKRVYISHT